MTQLALDPKATKVMPLFSLTPAAIRRLRETDVDTIPLQDRSGEKIS